MPKKAAKKDSPEKASKTKEPAVKKAAAKDVEAAAAAPTEKKAKAEKAPKAPKAPKAKKEAAAKGPSTDERWTELKEKHGKEKAAKYAMTGQFQANQPIEHPKLGWGFILSNNNDRLEVVFQEGVKILISNFNNSAPKI